MRIEIHRPQQIDPASNSTISVMYVDGLLQCDTLEDVVREVEGEPVENWKIPGETAIPRGNYRVTITYSQRFQRMLPLLLDVPGFSGVRIHPGNTFKDTEGCILVGVWDHKAKDFIGNSRVTFDLLYQKIKTAYDAGEAITLEIV